MQPEVAFGKVLRSLRLERNMTQEALGFEADLQRHYISLLERGSSSPTLKSIFRLAAALQISPVQLISKVQSEMRKDGRRFPD